MSITSRIAAFHSRYPNTELMVVTKFRTREETATAIAAGADLIGESRVQAGAEKFPLLPPCRRALIGHLQKNKVKDAVRLFDLIASVDSLAIAERLSEEATRQNKNLDIYLEANLAHEPQKYGFPEEEVTAAAVHIRRLPHLMLTGLLVMGRTGATALELATLFSRGREIATALNLPTYSAGMSGDYPIAIQSGATQVRLGSCLFT